MPMLKCPDCFRDVSDAAPVCPGCGRPLAAAVLQKGKPGEITGGQAVGVILALLGLLGIAYFLLLFEVSVRVPVREILGTTVGGGRVNNIGLMQDRQNGLLLTGAAVFAGLVLFVSFRRRN